MNAPDARRRREPGKVEIVREGDTIIMRRIVDPAEARRAMDSILKHMPKAKKGASILRDLGRLRLRGGDER